MKHIGVAGAVLGAAFLLGPAWADGVGGIATQDSKGNWQPASSSNPVPSVSYPQTFASYRVVTFGNTAYATPTDLACLRNPTGSGKTLYVTQFGIEPQSTSATLETWLTLKRTTLNGGGALATAVTPVPFDSGDAAAVAVLDVYTAAPSSLGTSAGTLNADVGQTTALAAPAPLFGLFAGNSGANGFPYFVMPGTNALTQPITLHAGEEICSNFNGAALPAGFTAGYIGEWTEK